MSVGLWQPRARSVRTTVPCLTCNAPLSVVRSCQSVQAQCTSCGCILEIGEVVARADEVMERFLEDVYCDRM